MLFPVSECLMDYDLPFLSYTNRSMLSVYCNVFSFLIFVTSTRNHKHHTSTTVVHPNLSTTSQTTSTKMACTFNREDPLGGLPPAHIMAKDGYTPVFTDKLQLEEALGVCKKTLEDNLKNNINLVRVSAPLFVTKASGFNDNLNVSSLSVCFAELCFLVVWCVLYTRWVRWKIRQYHWIQQLLAVT